MSATHTASAAAAAAQAQREATIIGHVAGTPIPRERLDARVRDLRAGRLAARLPAVGSKEDRQFLRWTAQVLLTEELCRVELARLRAEAGAGRDEVAEADGAEAARGSRLAETSAAGDAAMAAAGELPGRSARTSGELAGRSEPDASARSLTQAESLHLGSINAAAWANSAAMSALYDLVTVATAPAPSSTATATWYRVTHTVAATALEAATAAEVSLGWTTLDDLPATLAAELRVRPPGTRVGPVRTGLGWHFATVTATEVRPAASVAAPAALGSTSTTAAPSSTAAAAITAADPTRLAAFNRWLDQRRRALVVQAVGFEHPGDPSQPDNTHRH